MRATVLDATHAPGAHAAVQSIHARSAAQHKRTSNLMPCLRFWNFARTAGILLHRQEGSHCHTVLPRILYTQLCTMLTESWTGWNSSKGQASKQTGLQRQLDIARSTDAGDNSLTSWQEALLLGLVGASYEAHELTH